MERDFLSLFTTVKQEAPEEPTDPSVPFRSSAMQRSSSNKISNLPQYLSFKNSHEEKRRTGFDALALTGLVTITTTEAVDSRAPQNNMIVEKQGGMHYAATTYPAHYFGKTNQMPISMNVPVRQSFISPAGQNLFGSANVHPIGLVQKPVSPVPATNAVVGSTELRNAPQTTRGPAQLTIFYGGSVCVYDNISPEKAQAIMLLAGNGTPTTSRASLSPTPVQAYLPVSPVIDSFAVKQGHMATSCFPSPILKASNKAEPLNAVSPGSIQAAFVPSAVPQSRKASLARFLERRKERVMSASPYAWKESQDCNNSFGFSSLPATT